MHTHGGWGARGLITNSLQQWHDIYGAVFDHDNNCNIMYERKRQIAVMPVYRRAYRFSCVLHIILLLNLHTHICHTYSLLRIVRGSGYLASQAVKLNAQRIIIGKTYSENVSLSCRVINTILIVCFVTWLYILLLCSGDVHPNPGPTSSASNASFSSLSSNMSDLLHEMLNQNHHLSFVHYNVQSLLPKIDLLQAELQNFDIIALTETWLHAGIDTEELMLQPFNPPERKDRQTDRHGGVILYIKEGINYRRRHDLETGRVECIWIEITGWNYALGNYDLLRAKASETEWDSLRHASLDTYVINFTNHILQLAKECIPNKLVRIRPADPQWLTSYIKRFICKRKRAYRKAKRTDLAIHWEKFRRLRNKVTLLIRESKQAHTDKIANKLKSDSISSRSWWSILKSFISPTFKTAIPPLDHNGRLYTEEQEKANLLNTFFCEQTILNEQHAVLPDITPYAVTTRFARLVLTPDEVESVLKSLADGKASGPNGLNNRVLKELASEISEPLCSLFNYSLNLGSFPTPWKEANISPIPKKGDLSLLTNHRPVSLLNAESKVFECLVFKHLFNHIRDNNILTPLQSGFIPGDSTVNQLTFLYNTFCRALDEEKEIRVIFCDIKKAFDRVWHAGLLHKLKACGISDNILDWFKDYLFESSKAESCPSWCLFRMVIYQSRCSTGLSPRAITFFDIY